MVLTCERLHQQNLRNQEAKVVDILNKYICFVNETHVSSNNASSMRKARAEMKTFGVVIKDNHKNK